MAAAAAAAASAHDTTAFMPLRLPLLSLSSCSVVAIAGLMRGLGCCAAAAAAAEEAKSSLWVKRGTTCTGTCTCSALLRGEEEEAACASGARGVNAAADCGVARCGSREGGDGGFRGNWRSVRAAFGRLNSSFDVSCGCSWTRGALAVDACSGQLGDAGEPNVHPVCVRVLNASCTCTKVLHFFNAAAFVWWGRVYTIMQLRAGSAMGARRWRR